MADATGRLITFVVVAAAARQLEPTAFGVLAIATTAGWLLGVATDAGWSMHLARVAAQRPHAWRAALRAVLERRVAAAVSAQAAAMLAAPVLVPAADVPAFGLIVAWQLASAVLDTGLHVVRGLERTEYETAIQGGVRVATGVLALGALAWRPDVTALGLALLAPPLGGLAAYAIALRRLARARPSDHASPPLTWHDVRTQVLPLGFGAVVSALYFRCDVFFVEHWHGLGAAGAYSAVFRVVDAVRLVPAAVLAVSFPRLVRAADTREVARLAGALGVAGVALAVALATLATPIVVAAYGRGYRDAADVLVLLAPSVPLFFVNYALTHQLIGWDGQRAYAWTALAALAVNLAANLALVPRYGAGGAAVSTAVTELVVTAGCLVALRLPRLDVAAAGAPLA